MEEFGDGKESQPPLELAALVDARTGPTDDLLAEIAEAQRQDDDIAKIVLRLEAREPEAEAQYVMEEDGLLKKRVDEGTSAATDLRLVVPKGDVRNKVLHLCHDSPASGHKGQARTRELLGRYFVWPNWKKDVNLYVRTCPICQRTKADQRRPAGLLQPLPVANKKWESIATDLVVALPETDRGYDAIAVFLDRLTKMLHLVPTTTKVTAEGYARLFFDNVWKLHGLPRSIVSDRDTRFTSTFWKALWGMLGCELRMSTAFHPQTDGVTERDIRTVQETLRAYVSERQDDWDLRLAQAEYVYNNGVHAATQFTPFYLNYGVHPEHPAAIIVDATRARAEGANRFSERVHRDILAAKVHLEQARLRMRIQADRRRREKEFAVGDRVLLRTKNIELMHSGPSKKLQAQFVGPFRIRARIGPVAYRLELPQGWRIHNVFHVSLLREFNTTADYGERELEAPPPDLVDDEEEYEVERVIDHRRRRQGRQQVLEYLVKWRGYGMEEALWLPEGELRNAPQAVADYRAAARLG